MTTPSLLIRKARPSMSSSSWPESSRKSPSLANTASTTWAPIPRERAPIEKGKTSPCNRSPANKTPNPSLSRNCPPTSAPRSGKDRTAHQARSSDRALSSATAQAPIASSPSSPSRRLFEKSWLISNKENATRARHPSPSHWLPTTPLVRYPDTRRPECSLTPNSPGGRHFSTALPRLNEFCYPHQDSPGLHSPILVGEIRGPALGRV